MAPTSICFPCRAQSRLLHRWRCAAQQAIHGDNLNDCHSCGRSPCPALAGERRARSRIADPTPVDEAAPELPEVVYKGAIGIPRYQSIAADLDRLEQHRQRATMADDLLGDIDARVSSFLGTSAVDGWQELAEALFGTQFSDPYDRAKRREWARALTDRIARAAGLSPAQARDAELRLELLANERLVGNSDFAFEQRRPSGCLRWLVRLRSTARFAEGVVVGRRDLWAQFDLLEDAVWRALNTPATKRRLDSLSTALEAT